MAVQAEVPRWGEPVSAVLFGKLEAIPEIPTVVDGLDAHGIGVEFEAFAFAESVDHLNPLRIKLGLRGYR